MRKVKFFSGSDKTTKELEEQINEFCASHRVMDIQYQSFPVYTPGRDNKTIRSIDAFSRVMVVYKIEDECEDKQKNSTPNNRCCMNCKHENTLLYHEPCNNCKNLNKWEPKEDEKNERAE